MLPLESEPENDSACKPLLTISLSDNLAEGAQLQANKKTTLTK
jgi:hypothetical protein